MAEPSLRHICSYQATLEPVQHAVGVAHFGKRQIAVVTGGSFAGDRLRGDVLNGGGDWATIDEARDVLRLDARVTWRTDDGEKIYVSYIGILRPYTVVREIAARGAYGEVPYYFRTMPIFETGAPRYRWLNDIIAIGIGRTMPGGVSYEIYEAL